MNEIEKAKIGKELLKDLPLIEENDVPFFIGIPLHENERKAICYRVNEKFKQRVAELRIELPKMPPLYGYEYENGEVAFYQQNFRNRPTNCEIICKIENYIVEDIPVEKTPDKLPVKLEEVKMLLQRISEAGIEA